MKLKENESNFGMKLIFILILIIIIVFGLGLKKEFFINFKENTLTFIESIYDFRAPVFLDNKTKIKIEKDAVNFTLADYFEVKDYNFYSLEIIENGFDISKEGSYTIDVIATDIKGNRREKQVLVEVVSFEQALAENLTANKFYIIPTSERMLAHSYNYDASNTAPNMNQVNAFTYASKKTYEEVTDPIALKALSLLGSGGSCSKIAESAISVVGLSAWKTETKGYAINNYLYPENFLELGVRVSLNNLKQGDLLYYADGGTGVSHIAIYVGNNQAVHGNFNGIAKTGAVSMSGVSTPIGIRLNR